MLPLVILTATVQSVFFCNSTLPNDKSPNSKGYLVLYLDTPALTLQLTTNQSTLSNEPTYFSSSDSLYALEPYTEWRLRIDVAEFESYTDVHDESVVHRYLVVDANVSGHVVQSTHYFKGDQCQIVGQTVYQNSPLLPTPTPVDVLLQAPGRIAEIDSNTSTVTAVFRPSAHDAPHGNITYRSGDRHLSLQLKLLNGVPLANIIELIVDDQHYPYDHITYTPLITGNYDVEGSPRFGLQTRFPTNYPLYTGSDEFAVNYINHMPLFLQDVEILHVDETKGFVFIPANMSREVLDQLHYVRKPPMIESELCSAKLWVAPEASTMAPTVAPTVAPVVAPTAAPTIMKKLCAKEELSEITVDGNSVSQYPTHGNCPNNMRFMRSGVSMGILMCISFTSSNFVMYQYTSVARF